MSDSEDIYMPLQQKYKMSKTVEKGASGGLFYALAAFIVTQGGPLIFGDSFAELKEVNAWAVVLFTGLLGGTFNATRNFVKHKLGWDIPVIT